ncbi:2,3-diaminopropionate biosynthesis protein SbnA [Streptomyces sp. NPDC051172]|uniref:2,3-diaminopropionate biosynthesis protein SbnA n=1 Tax=Streptomyces sp. NPDC051172 TaxID=3155796 RepID=UPI00341BD13D
MIADHAFELFGEHAFLALPGFTEAFGTTLKIEGLNPAGSIKLKTARGLVEALERSGRLVPSSALIESTSGNLGIALASVCAAKKYPLTLVTDPNANQASIRAMRALGAEVIVVTERDANGGFLQTRIDCVRRRLSADPNLVWTDQYAHPANPASHRHSTAVEIMTGFGLPDWLFIGTGTAGTLMGCVHAFRDVGGPTRIVAVDTVGSVTFGRAARARHIPGLGSSRPSQLLRDDGSFIKVLVPESETVRTCRQVARRYGLLVGGSTGTVLSAVARLAPAIEPGSRVLAVSADLGDRYLDTIYNDDWVAERYGSEVLRDEPDAARPAPVRRKDELINHA